MTAAALTYKVKGSTEDVTTCECCGRVDLKKTIIMELVDADGNTEERLYFGRVCAAKHAGRAVKEIDAEVKQADSEVDKMRREADTMNREFDLWKKNQDADAVKADASEWRAGKAHFLYETSNWRGTYFVAFTWRPNPQFYRLVEEFTA